MIERTMISTLVVVLAVCTGPTWAGRLSPLEQLGKIMYQDKEFSFNATQSCQTCHHHVSGFADPSNSRDPYSKVVSTGADGVSLGARNAPSTAYAGYSPVLHLAENGNYYGGMFWDGRATGSRLGDPLAEQAQGPPLNPVEMNMPGKEAVVEVVRNSNYATLFLEVFGENSLIDPEDAYDNIARAIAAYERSQEVQKFNSRFDNDMLSDKEINGLILFQDKCAQCHSLENLTGQGPLFTNHGYANIGIPINPLLADNPVDLGLGGFLDTPSQNGKFKIPTLRNVARTAPYGHNGYFGTLKDIIHFKNTRDLGGWESPEVMENLNQTDVGDLGLSNQEEDDIAAFLITLTDPPSRQ
jgi:cytochrome c peroxidase